MNTRIHILPQELANQIAAGEVVERPASVAKELLENSLDAKASRIHVDVMQGGIKLLRVRDNGEGIVKDDLPLALCRHATSKINEIHDLHVLQSLGFRGEALASISSVSKLTLTSCRKEETMAWEIQMEGRDLNPVITPRAHPVGTTVEVRDLFFNIPARRKFLRSEKTEFYHIEELFKRIALSHFQTSFILQHNQRTIYHLPEAHSEKEQENRIAKICGSAFLTQSIRVDFSAIGMRLWGWLGTPEFARSQTDLQFFFINKRIIRDRLINHAIKQAYHDRLYEGRHPSYVLFLEIDSQELDVNVHPTKHEVRFHQGRLVHDFIISHCQKALQKVNEEILEITHINVGGPEPKNVTKSYYPFLTPSESALKHQKSHYEMTSNQNLKEEIVTELNRSEKTVSFYKRVGLMHEKYLLAESAQGFAIIHLHYAKQLIAHHQLLMHQQQPYLTLQPLLVPHTVSVEEARMEVVEQFQPVLYQSGLVVEISGPTTIMVKQMLSVLKSMDVKFMLNELLSKLPGIAKEKETEAGLHEIAKILVSHLKENFLPLSTRELDEMLADLSAIVAEKQTSVKLAEAIKFISLHELEHYF